MFNNKKDDQKKDDQVVKKAGLAETDEAVNNDNALVACQKNCAEYLAGWQRAQADYKNLVKETEARRQEWLIFAGLEMLHGILPIYDHLKLALMHIPEEQKKLDWVVGIEHIKNQMKKFFEAQGIEEIKTVGQEFDPALHEAVEHENTKTQPANSQNGLSQQVEGAAASHERRGGGSPEERKTQKHENTTAEAGQTGVQNELIKKEVRAGYKLNGKVIQAAKVIV